MLAIACSWTRRTFDTVSLVANICRASFVESKSSNTARNWSGLIAGGSLSSSRMVMAMRFSLPVVNSSRSPLRVDVLAAGSRPAVRCK